MRYFIELAYNGKDYHGWQYQPNAASVQETLNNALSVLFNTKIEIMGAGRTDAGVHAKQMYAHFDIPIEIDVISWVRKLNSYLPKDIVIFKIIPVQDDAHTRFDATRRSYEYHIHQFKNVFEHEGSWYFHQKLNIDLMNEAGKLLLNHTDFKCFSKSNTDVNTYNCDIFEARWTQHQDKLVFSISADRFLRNMVRAIVGTMVNVGLEKISLDDFKMILESRDRNKAGFSVPAHGLYLTKVVYPYI
ncbi:tRNA pseudouridine(38-40) synthase TruA [Flavobacterium sp. '19STA2R22 D10 B1']|uniref:tRNA pseudouridine(38-40) synthase TruA n=1 Tax=Flavobacterium aerium TaxID=3037261 RepID=UPI00278C52A6|nr:tRNA pseudouridine(38-40) synthase TruA [Flavobacterium sp. '19STA2R22 D10 B1']